MARAKQMIPAIAYLRTSSAANVGSDKDGETRQRLAIEAFADRAGFAIVAAFYDAAVSGEDQLETRPGFSALLDRVEGNGVRTVIVEDATRFARDLITQELGILALVGRGVRVLTASGDDLTETSDPFKVAMRQIAGAFAQLEKARLVSKLKAARDRKREKSERTTTDGRPKLEGRKSYVELNPEAVELARKLRRSRPKGGRRSLRDVSEELARAGYLTRHGKPYAAAAVAKMVGA